MLQIFNVTDGRLFAHLKCRSIISLKHFVEIRTDVSIYTVMKLLSVRVSECPGCQQCSSEASLSFRSDSAQRISVGLIPPMKLKSSRSPHKYKVQWLDAILDFSISAQTLHNVGLIMIYCQIHGTFSPKVLLQLSWWWQIVKAKAQKKQVSVFAVKKLNHTEYQTKFPFFSI